MRRDIVHHLRHQMRRIPDRSQVRGFAKDGDRQDLVSTPEQQSVSGRPVYQLEQDVFILPVRDAADRREHGTGRFGEVVDKEVDVKC